MRYTSMITGLLFAFALFLTSCAGYQVTNYSNPLRKYGIERLKVLNFYNESTFQGVGSSYSSQAYHAMSEFVGLKLVKLSQGADASLLGVVSSNRFKNKSQGSASKSVVGISGRQQFQVAATNQIGIRVDYYIIKDKDLQNLRMVRNTKSSEHISNSVLKSISLFHRSISLSAQVRRELFLNSGSKVNYAQNKKAIQRKIEDLAKKAASQLRDELLHDQQF